MFMLQYLYVLQCLYALGHLSNRDLLLLVELSCLGLCLRGLRIRPKCNHIGVVQTLPNTTNKHRDAPVGLTGRSELPNQLGLAAMIDRDRREPRVYVTRAINHAGRGQRWPRRDRVPVWEEDDWISRL